METKPREAFNVDELVYDDRVHRRVYTDPEIFDLEMDRIFGRSWLFVAHESEVANPGDYKRTYVGKQPVIVTRSQDGNVNVLFNRCMHRGALVCMDESGNSNHFRCPYHGWTFRNDGSLIGVPYRKAYGPDFDQKKLNLMGPAQVANYRGFVFVNLDPEAPSLDEHLGPAKFCIDNIVDRAPEGRVSFSLGAQKYVFHGNWKYQVENMLDHYHVSFVHESTADKKGRQFKRQTGLSEEHLFEVGGNEDQLDSEEVCHAFPHGHGYVRRADVSPQLDTTAAKQYAEALTERLGSERTQELLSTRLHNSIIYPNLAIQQPSAHIRVFRPISVDLTEVSVYPMRFEGAPEEINRATVRSINVTHSPASFIQTDDTEVFRRVHEGLQAEGPEWVIWARGLHRETPGEHPGELVATSMDEVGQRAQYRQWRELMGAEGTI